MIVLVVCFLSLALGLLYLYHVDRGMSQVPDEAHRFSPRRWTVDEIKQTYERNVHSPVNVTEHLPPKQNRRYAIVGGSGLVGNWIVSHLLSRGEDPAAIRILDLQSPRQQLLDQGVVFIQTNITDKKAVSGAFSQPWPSTTKSIDQLPLTVYHTAAVIRFSERLRAFLPLCTTVNVDGTRNVLEAARAAGASCFIATSSGSVGLRLPSFWIAPWEKIPQGLVQVLSDRADGQPKEYGQFFGNYSASKFEAEMMVRSADDPQSKFRTGCIRPANGVYGIGADNSGSVLGLYLRSGGNPTWTSRVIQNFVNAENVSLAHLLYEQHLISSTQKQGTSDSDIGGQSFVVTDPNPPVTFSDIYLLLTTLAKTPMHFDIVPAIPLFLLSYLVESYALLQYRYFPQILPSVPKSLVQLQPALFAVSNAHTIVDDSRARLAPEKGGLGYSPPVTSLDGMCMEVAAWNRNVVKEA